MSYWSDPICSACQDYAKYERPCPYHEAVGEGYEAGFEAAMQSLVRAVSPFELTRKPRRFILVSPENAVLRETGQWRNTLEEPQWFDTEAESKAAIATAPRWWPKQPWEVE